MSRDVVSKLVRVAFWMTELPEGGFAMGEAPDEAEARPQIARQQGRASVTFHKGVRLGGRGRAR